MVAVIYLLRILCSIDDDFTDFQAAPLQAGQTVSQVKKPTLLEMIGSTPALGLPVNTGFTPAYQNPPMAYGMNTPGFATGLSGHRQQLSLSSTQQLTPVAAQPQVPLNLLGNTTAPLRPTPMAMGSTTMSAPGLLAHSNTEKRPTAPVVKSSSNFDDLWSLSLGSTSTATSGIGAGKSIKDLEKEKATAGLWGARQTVANTSNTKPAAFGAYNTVQPSGGDDLLL